MTPGVAGSGTWGPYIQIPYGHYGYSSWMSNRIDSEIASPASLFLLMDATNPWNDTCQNAIRLCYRHNEGGNFAFADGHVKWQKSRTARPNEWWPTLLGFHGLPGVCTNPPTTTWAQIPVTACIP